MFSIRSAIESLLARGLSRGSLISPVLSSTLTSLGATNQTLTAAQLLGGFVEATPTGAATYTTDTAANLDAALPGALVGDWFDFQVINTAGAANAITIAAGAGVTKLGSAATIAQNKTAFLVLRKTGAGAWTCYVTISA